MWPISDRFAQEITRGHKAVSKVELLSGDEVIATLSDDGIVIDGSVSVSSTATQRTGTLDMVDLTGLLTPRSASDLFAPVGNQIRLWRGVRYSDGTDEFCPIGTLRYTATLSNFPRINLTDMQDRSWIVAGAKLETAFTVAAGTSAIDALASLLDNAYPGVPTNFPTTDETTNAMFFDVDTDPWEACQDIAANLGMRLFFDPMGVACLVTDPDEDDTPVWTFDDTQPDNMALPGTQLALSGIGYNAVTVLAENSDLPAPLRATAKDLNPLSPFQYGGAYGKRPLTIRDEKIATQAQANSRAVMELRNNLGLVEVITIPSMVHPALDAGDPIAVNITRVQDTDDPPIPDRSGIVDSLQVPLRNGTCTVTTRQRRAVTIE